MLQPSARGERGWWRRDLLLLAFAVALLYGPHLGRRALWHPDEGRYAEIPREMVASGDYVTPRLDGIKYFEKPPLVYWMEAGALRLLGPHEWALRLVPAGFALAGVLLVAAAAGALFGRRAGRWAGVVLATSMLWFGLGEAITLDMVVSVLLGAALLAFLFATRSERPWPRRLWIWAFYAAAALATLTKGLIGIVIPAMVIAPWILLYRRWRLIRLALAPSGIALFLAIAAPWHLLAARANPEFAWFYFVHEHFLRYTTTIHSRYEPLWFFVPILLAGMLPWAVFLPAAIRGAISPSDDAEERRSCVYLLLWAGLVFAFFSASDSKLVPYILPVVPPLAMLLGRAVAQAWELRRQHGAAYLTLLLAGAILAAAFLAVGRVPKAAAAAAALGGYVPALAVSQLLLGLLPLLLDRARRPRAALLACAGGACLFLTLLGVAMPRLDADRSVKALALALAPRLQPGDEVVSYRNYFQDLPFYLRRRVTVARFRGELQFGSEQEDVSGWMIDDPELERRWRSDRRLFLVAEERQLTPTLRDGLVLARAGSKVLLANRPGAAGAGGEPR